MRQNSAKLRELARALCEQSAKQRRLTQWRPTRREVADWIGRPCDICGEVVARGDVTPAAERPTHAACYATHLQSIETALVTMLGSLDPMCCRRCLASALDTQLAHVYLLTARLLARRAIRTAAAACGRCGRPSLVVGPRDARMTGAARAAGQSGGPLLS